MLKAVFDWFRSPSPRALAPTVQPEAAPYKVEAPVVAPTMEPATVTETAPVTSTHTTAAAKKPAVKKTQQRTVTKPAVSDKGIKDFEIKDIVSRLQNAQPMYADDQDRLNRLINGLRKGTVSTSVDTAALLRTLKDAQQGKSLSDEQKQILVNYKNNL